MKCTNFFLLWYHCSMIRYILFLCCKRFGSVCICWVSSNTLLPWRRKCDYLNWFTLCWLYCISGNNEITPGPAGPGSRLLPQVWCDPGKQRTTRNVFSDLRVHEQNNNYKYKTYRSDFHIPIGGNCFFYSLFFSKGKETGFLRSLLSFTASMIILNECVYSKYMIQGVPTSKYF